MNCPANTAVPGPTKIVRGRTWRFDATVYTTYISSGNVGNVVKNFTGWTVKAQIRTKAANKIIASLPVVFPVPTSGALAVDVSRAFTKALPLGDYNWDIVGTSPVGQDRRLLPVTPIKVIDEPTDPSL